MTRPIVTAASSRENGIADTDPRTGGFARVARLIAGRTTDLIAIGVVLIGSLAFGRQAIIWWRTEPDEITHPQVIAEQSDPWGAAPVEIEFGDAPLAVSRETVAGEREAALARLTTECRALAENPEAVVLESPAGDAMLARLSTLTPIESEPGQWSVYRLEDQFSLVVAVCNRTAKEARSAASQPGLICFGMAVPAGESQWTLFLFRGANGVASGGGLSSSDFVPDGFKRLLALRGVQGELLAGVAGQGSAESWRASLESKLHARGWNIRGEWSIVDRTWSAQFGRTNADESGALSVVMTSNGDNDWTGLIHQSP